MNEATHIFGKIVQKKKRQIQNIIREDNIMTIFGSNDYKYIFNIDTKIKNIDGTIMIKCEKDKNIKIIFKTIEDFINILLWIKE